MVPLVTQWKNIYVYMYPSQGSARKHLLSKWGRGDQGSVVEVELGRSQRMGVENG